MQKEMTTETQRSALDALKYFKPPFIYEPIGQTIYCVGKSGNSMALQVRGWGELIGGGAFALEPKEAASVQDQFGEWVAKVMNEALTPPAQTICVCKTCQGCGAVSTTDKDHNGDHIEIKCPTCTATTPAVAILDQKDMPNEIRAWGDGTWKDASCDNAIVASLTSVYELKKAVSAKGVTDEGLAHAVKAINKIIALSTENDNGDFYETIVFIPYLKTLIKAATAPNTCADKGE